MKKSGWVLGLMIATGGLLGAVLSEVLKALTPDGPVQTVFLQSVALAIDPPFALDLVVITITVGAIVKINLLTIVGMFFGLYVDKNF